MTFRILLLGLDKYFFGLDIAAISHVHVGFCYRINLVGVNATGTSLTEIGLSRSVRGVDTLTSRVAEDRISRQAEAATLWRQGAGRIQRHFLLAGTTTSRNEVCCQKCKNPSATGQCQRIVEQSIDETGLLKRRRWSNRRFWLHRRLRLRFGFLGLGRRFRWCRFSRFFRWFFNRGRNGLYLCRRCNGNRVRCRRRRLGFFRGLYRFERHGL